MMWQLLKNLTSLVMLGWILYSWVFRSDPRLPCPDPEHADPLIQPECFFSENFLASRALFRSAAKKAGAELHLLTLSDSLAIDVAVLPAKTQKGMVMLHFSGTHGVEGYVGSAIQSATLTQIASKKLRSEKTLIFVHGLNVFGMANWRRFNENNVDLNRNALFTDKKLQELLNRDPNIAGYENWTSHFNPTEKPTGFGDAMRLFHVARALALSSFSSLKRAMVTGTYSNSRGIFFGGRSLQASHAAVREFLHNEGYLEQTKQLILIDVHSGLGPWGRDTLMMNDHYNEVKNLYGTPNNKTTGLEWVPPFALEIQSLAVGKGNIASDGYDVVTGDVQSQYPLLFSNLEFLVSVSQEFGTYPAPLVVSFF